MRHASSRRPARRSSVGRGLVVSTLAAAMILGWPAASTATLAGAVSPLAATPVEAPTQPPPARCGPASPGEAIVETYLARNVPRFGRVVRDGQLAGPDCAAVRAFQHWAATPEVTGAAGPVTTAVAKRLVAVDLRRCAAKAVTTVCVDLTTQTMWVIRAGRLLLGPTVVRTGRPGQATPTGWFAISQKKRHTVSSEYHTPLPFWQRFYRDFGFHAAETPMYAPIAGSHGCVNLLRRDADALFGLTGIRTTVHVFGRKAGT